MAARMSHSDLRVLLEAIRQLYELREPDDFWRVVPEIVPKVIAMDGFALVECVFNPQTRTIKTLGLFGDVQATDDNVARMERYVPTHPFTHHVEKHGLDSALMFSDFFTRSQFLSSELFSEQYRLLGASRGLSAGVADGSRLCTLNAFRGLRARDFSERDRLMLTLMRPHFEQARKNALLFGERRARAARPLAEFDLTPREREVATWLARGKTNGEIAIILGSSSRTVEKHVAKVLEKLGVENRTAAAVMITDGL